MIAAAALVGAIGIQLVEVGQLRADGPIRSRTQGEIKRLANAAQKVIDGNIEGDENRPLYDEPKDDVEGGGDEYPDEADEEGDGMDAEEEEAEEEEEEEIEEEEEG